MVGSYLIVVTFGCLIMYLNVSYDEVLLKAPLAQDVILCASHILAEFGCPRPRMRLLSSSSDTFVAPLVEYLHQ